MRKSIESKIRLNVVMIYVIVAVICCGMIFYFYTSGYDIDSQKKDISLHYKDIAQTNELIHAVNEVQKEANLYVATKQLKNLRLFRQQLQELEYKIDSLKSSATEFPMDTTLLTEVSLLLKEKGKTITALNRQFNDQLSVSPIREKTRTSENTITKDTLISTPSPTSIATVQDTVVQAAPKKNFWQRLSNVFSSGSKPDTIITVKTLLTDTLKVIIPETDSLHLHTEMDRIVTEVNQSYRSRINAIEKQVSQLILADQEISSKISGVLIKLYTHTVERRFEEIQREEETLYKNNTRAIISGVVALILILFFIILIIQDVNKGSAARKALEEANIKMQDLMDSRHKLLLSVSHDVKTPLNSILGYLELNRNSKTFTEKEISSMQNSGKHILALLENLLQFSSLEQGTMQLTNRDFSLLELCQETTEMFSPLAKQKKLEFNCCFDFDDGLYLHSDPLKIKQILINLLSNAIKYTIDGNITFEVSVSEDILILRIADTGVGIPADQLERIYQPFSRIDRNNTLAEGSGYGMYVVKGLVNLLQGNIRIFSQVDEGTEARIHIPVKAVIPLLPELSVRKILVVDDDDSYLAMLRAMGKESGHSMVTCNGMKGFEEHLVELATYDMVLTDMEMGIYSGADILRKVRDIDANIPVFLMTGRSDYHLEMAKEAGFNGYLSKPVTISSLNSAFGGCVIESKKENVLGDMFNKDSESILEILEIFMQSTINNLVELRGTIKMNDFKKAQSLCHKMLPMFMQIGDPDTVVILKEIDLSRSKEVNESFQWKEKIEDLIDKTETFLMRIQDEYFAD